MKTLFSLLASLFITSVVLSQTVTINTTGNRNRQLTVDSKSYTITNTTATEEQAIVITDLVAGQHSLEVIRNNQYNTRVSTKTYFTLREGYDLTITINASGAVSTAETRITTWGNNSNNNAIKPISTAAFNKLYSQTKAKTSSTSRTSFLENEFANTNKRFTAKQASQLIQLVSSEGMRFKLAKLSYSKITDRQNFNLVSSLLNSSSNRTELNNYIATVDLDDDDLAASDTGVPMNDEKFRTIYNEVYAENTSSDRYYYLNNFFSRDFNFYTSYQAGQLIQLQQTEEERFNLAKAAYRGVTDRENYGIVSQLLSNSANRTALSVYINTYNSTNNNNGNVGVAMSTTNFNNLYNTIYYQSSSARYSSIYSAFTSQVNFFTVTQAKKLIPLVSDENSRLLLAKTVYPKLTDKENYLQFNEFLVSSSSRTDLYNYVVNYNSSNGTNVGLEMSTTNFNSLYNTIYYQSSSVRYSSIYSAFTNPANYFTVAQAKKLIPLVNDENSRLLLSKTVYSRLTDKENYAQFNEFLVSSSSRNDLYNYVVNYSNNSNGNIGLGMSEANYNTLYQDITNSWSQSTRLNIETEAFRNTNNRFTVDQVRRLLLLMSSESDRLALAKNAFDNTVDQSNYSQLYDVLSTTAYRNDLANYITNNGGIGTGVVPVVAMSESAYNSMYNSVQSSFGIGAKYSSLTDIFNTATNYFTTQQAKELVRLVSSESNRLTLAKLSYNNIVDPENFTIMYDVFSSESSKTELRNFVSTNPAIGQ